MKLRDLSRESGVSTASIKYCIHVGILPACTPRSRRRRVIRTTDHLGQRKP